MIEPKSSTAARLGAWTGAGTPLVLFITLGLPAGVLGVAWPHMRAALGRPLVVSSLAATGSWRASFAALAVAFLAVGLIVGSRRRDWIHTASIQRHAVTTTPVPSEYRRALVVLTCLCFLGGGLEA